MTDAVRPAMAFITFELKLFFREFVPIFFNLVIPIGAYCGAGLSHLSQGEGAMLNFFQQNTPSFVVIMTLSVGLLTVANGYVIYREVGVFKRLMASPLDPAVFVISAVVRGLVVIATVILLMMAASLALTGRLPNFSVLGFLLTETYAACGVFAASFLVGTFFKTQKSVFAVSVVLFYGLWFLSGAVVLGAAAPFQHWLNVFSPSFYMLQLVRLGWNGRLLSAQVWLPLTVVSVCTAASIFAARLRLTWVL